MTLNEYFDKIFCINLDRRPDRWSQCLEEFEKHQITVERFAAIDGNKREGGPVKGCRDSHAEILRGVANERWKRVLILEDDVEFAKDLQRKFSDRIADVPNDYDMLYFCGHEHHWWDKSVKINKWVARICGVYSAAAYSISVTYAQYMLPTLLHGHRTVDNAYRECEPGHVYYMFVPMLATQRMGYSDIMRTVRDIGKNMPLDQS